MDVLQGQIAGPMTVNLLFTFGNIPGYRPVRTGKVFFVFLRQPLINPLGRMSLLALGFFVLCQPGINITFERIQLGKFNLSQRTGLALIPVLFLKVRPHCFAIPPGFLRYLRDTFTLAVI